MSETSDQARIDKLMTDLRVVLDPEIGLSVVDMGMIRDVQFKDDQAKLIVVLTSPFCPFAHQIASQIKDKAEASLGMPVEVELSQERWDPSMMPPAKD